MTDGGWEKFKEEIPEAVRALLVILLGFYLGFFVFHAVQVIDFPFDVDNGEGFLLWQSIQFSQGDLPYESLQEPPWLVANYPPVYPLLCSFFIDETDPSFVPGRMISFISSLLTGLALAWMVYKLTSDRFAAVVSSLFFLGSYHVYGWGALHRVDMLAQLFSVLALAIAVERKHWLFSALLCSLALLTRQTAFAASLAIGAYMVYQGRGRAALGFWLTIVVLVSGISFTLNTVTEGEYLRHIVLYNQNAFSFVALLFFVRHFWQLYAVLGGLAAFVLLKAIRENRWTLSLFFLLFSLVPAAMSGKVGAAPNYWLGLVFALCWIAGQLYGETRAASEEARSWLRLLIPVLLLFQVLETFHVPHAPPLIRTGRFDFEWTPVREDIRREQILPYLIERAGGPTLVEDPGLALRSGQDVLFQPFILAQLERQGLWDPTPLLEKIESQDFAMIVLKEDLREAIEGTERFSAAFAQAIQNNYEVAAVHGARRRFFIYTPAGQRPETPEESPSPPRLWQPQ